MGRNRILFIHPGKFSLEPCYPPLELLFMASFLEEHGYIVSVIDQRTEEDWEIGLKGLLDDCLWVGITSMTGEKILDAIHASKTIKSLDAQMPVVWGGWHSTFVPESVIGNDYVDYVVIGIGELKLLELTKHIQEHGRDPICNDSVLHASGNISCTIKNEHFKWMNKLPSYNLIDIERYRSENNIAGTITSRGCPFSCYFCTIAKFGYSARSVDTVIEELCYLVDDKKFSQITYMDGLFFANKARTFEIVERAEQCGLQFSWQASLRGDTLREYDDSDLLRLKKSGLTRVFVGAESGSENMLKIMNKKITPDDLLHLARKTAEHGIELSASFICGLPHEHIEDLSATISLAEKMRKANQTLRILNPFYRPIPGSNAYHEMIKLGWNPPECLEDWGRIKWNLSPDDVDQFLWMDSKEFSDYMRLYKNSILHTSRATTLDRQ